MELQDPGVAPDRKGNFSLYCVHIIQNLMKSSLKFHFSLYDECPSGPQGPLGPSGPPGIFFFILGI